MTLEELILRALKGPPLTAGQLTLALPTFHEKSVYRAIQKMHDEKKIFVARYDLDVRGRLIVRKYARGNHADAPRPGPRETSAERSRRVRAAARANS